MILIILTLALIIIGERIAMKKQNKMFDELYKEVDSITSKIKP